MKTIWYVLRDWGLYRYVWLLNWAKHTQMTYTMILFTSIFAWHRRAFVLFSSKLTSLIAKPISIQRLNVSVFMVFRKDILDAAGLDPPRTWRDFLSLAAEFNGTDMNGDGVGDYGACIDRSLCKPRGNWCVLRIYNGAYRIYTWVYGWVYWPAMGVL